MDANSFLGKLLENTLVIEFGAGWKEYLYDPKHPEFKELVQSLNEKLEEAGKKGSKGSGKMGKFAGSTWKGQTY